MAQQSIVDWAADSSLVDGVLFGPPAGEGLALPICAVAVVGGSRGHGKGLTQADALCSALGEALEQYAAHRLPSEPFLCAPLREVEGHAFDPSWLGLYSSLQYQTPAFPYRPFDPERAICWTPGYWLDTGEPVLLPAAAVYLNGDLETGEALCQMTSNGVAAGESISDAAARAALELYERGEFLRTWLTRRPASPADLSELPSDLAALPGHWQDSGARADVMLLCRDPYVALCIARGDARRWPAITLGLGAAWQPGEAVRKALLEHGQTGPYLGRLWRDHECRIPLTPEDIHSFQDHALYYCDPGHAAAFDFFREGVLHPPPATANVRIAIADLTPRELEDSPFRVVRALAKGLQAIHSGSSFERSVVPQIEQDLCGSMPNPAPVPLC